MYSNAQKLYILGSGQSYMCHSVPNASRIYRNRRPITPITENQVSKVQKKGLFSKIKTIALINLNVEHDFFYE